MNRVDEIREAAEADLVTFINLIHPQRVLGSVHIDLINWWYREESSSHQLVLLPRDHAKSAMVAYRVAWELTKDPSLRVLYISSTANLATKQLKFIKDIFTSKKHMKYWPDHINIDEGKREKWTESEISLDHPKRKEEAIRDPSIFTAGLTTGITGMHCDISVMDDVVVRENAYTKDGRSKVQQQYSMLSSIEAADAREWIVGTRYDQNDLYNDLQEMKVEIFTKTGEVLSEEPLYEVYEQQAEDAGDGSGEYLWPRQQRYDGKWFGFDQSILARKKAQYLDKHQFYCQYYNDPNKGGSGGVDISKFQYYERKQLEQNEEGYWYIKGRKLNVYAAIDFAFSLKRRADYTAIVVVGIDSLNNYYVLDIDRFKTEQISEYFKHIVASNIKWSFRKLRAEISVGQKVIVEELKNKIKDDGMPMSIDEFRPPTREGDKEERIEAVLGHKYDNMQMWHYKGGNCQSLEEELRSTRPPHDDIKDALAAACSIAKPPARRMGVEGKSNVIRLGRFGGVA